MDEQLESNYILSKDGLKLNCVIKDVESPKAIVCMLHGHGEHAGRYNHVTDFLHGQGIASVVLDMRGHGLSRGKRGHMPSMEYVLEDVEEALKFTRSLHLDTPMFLFGHSFGGCVVLNYVLKMEKSELAGFIASSPWLALAFEPPRWKVKMGEVLAGVLPRMTLKSELDPKHLSKIEEVGKEYVTDPLVHSRISARFFQEVNFAGKYALENAEKVELSGMVYHGNVDKIIDFKSSKAFSEKAKERIEFHELDGVYHEPHNDEEKEEVLKLLDAFISKRLTV